MPKILFKHGPEAKLPTLSEGEPGFTTDTNRFLVGSASGNVELSKKTDVDAIATTVNNHETEIENARGGLPTIKDRLDNVDSSLADIATNLNKYDLLKIAVAQGWDYAPALNKAITDLPSNGGAILIPNKEFGIYSNVTINKSLLLIGTGFSSMLRGTGSLITDGDQNHKLIIQNLKIVTTGSNDGVVINKTWTSSAVSTFQINNVWFHSEADAGALLNIYGARESGITNCWFTGTNTTYTGNINAILLRADTNGGAMNIDITGNKFMNVGTAIYGNGTTGYHQYLAGFRMLNNMFIGCKNGIQLYNTDYILCEQSMFDYVNNPIFITYCPNPKIRNNYIGISGSGNKGVEIINTYSSEMQFVDIRSNRILCYAVAQGTGTGTAISLTAQGGGIAYGDISGNHMDNVTTGVNLVGQNGNLVQNMNIDKNRMRSSTNGIISGSGTQLNSIDENYFETSVTNPITDNGVSNFKKRNRVGNRLGFDSGKLIANGNGSTTMFTIQHNCYASPNKVVVMGGSSNCQVDYANYDATNIYVYLKTAPASGTNNVVLNYFAEV